MKNMLLKTKTTFRTIFVWLDKIAMKIWDFASEHPFGINVLGWIILVYFMAVWVDNWGFNTIPDASDNQVRFLNLSVLIWAFAFMFQSFSLLFLEQKIKKLKKSLTQEGFKKFMEYQYKKNDESIFSGLTYILTVSISLLAIYTSFTSMQLSIDIANSNGEPVKMIWTEQMFESLWKWLWILIFIFIFYFFFYKFNQLSKRNYLERIYYWEYKRK